jgi:hypothetical protein
MDKINKIVLTVGNRSPSLTDQILTNNRPTNITGADVDFKMRPVGSNVLKVNSPAVVTSATTGRIQYDWDVSDVNTEGEYRAWWTVTFASGNTQDTPEFIVIFDSHSEGLGTTEGEISYQARQHIPLTWDALSTDSRYGDRMLKSRTDYVKYHLFATVVSPLSEATIYNPLILDYAAKCLALQIIPAGIEYWMNQQTSVATSGTSESVTYPDRIKSLEAVKEWLTAEVVRLQPELGGSFVRRRKINLPGITPTGTDFRTPDPNTYPKHFNLPPTTIPWLP